MGVANNAKIYVGDHFGDHLCGTFQNKVDYSSAYTFNCDTTGDFIKIVTERDDGKLCFE